MKDRDFQRLKGSVQEMVDAESNTLTEQDAAKLEKVGFEVRREEGGLVGDPDFVELYFSLECTTHAWVVGCAEIDAALIGVLVGMAQKRRWTVSFCGYATAACPARTGGLTLYIYVNATPRQIFDALIEVLEATDEGE